MANSFAVAIVSTHCTGRSRTRQRDENFPKVALSKDRLGRARAAPLWRECVFEIDAVGGSQIALTP